MSFPKYPEYKHSGINWIAKVPSTWSVQSLKRGFTVVGGSTPSADALNWNGSIHWATPADLSGLSSLFLRLTKRTLSSAGMASCGCCLLPTNSVILSTRAPIGSLAINTVPMTINQGCKGLVPNDNVDAVFFAYTLSISKEILNNLGKGTTFLELSGDELGRFQVMFPSYPEQTQIARFLDHETAKIDALIREQERLIELLQEKRQAVISLAVTKGLDPNVPMKDSGVEWLGEVPEHWEVTRIGWKCNVGNGCTPSRERLEYWEQGRHPWLNSSVVNQQRVKSSDQFVTDQALKECALPSVRKGSVLIAITGEGKTRGMATITEIDTTINQHVAYIEPRDEKLNAVFLHDWLVANYYRIRFESNGYGSTKAALRVAIFALTLCLSRF